MQATPVLVTGAGGFIGSHLVEALIERGAEVRALIRYSSRADAGNLELLPPEIFRRVEIVRGNIEDPDCVLRAASGRAVVFHLSSLIAIPYSFEAPRSYLRTNVDGAMNVCQACRAEGCRLVHVSTSEVYGSAEYTPMDERHPLRAQSPYAASKIAADKVVESFHHAFGLSCVTVRPFNTYGPRQSARAVIPTIVSQALSDLPEIRLGSLSPIRDLTFVSDTVEGMIAAATTEGLDGALFNLGVGTGVSIGEVAAMILRLLGSQKPVVSTVDRVRPGSSEVLELVSDNRVARARTGWSPKVSLEEGLERVIAFVRQHPEHFRPREYTL